MHESRCSTSILICFIVPHTFNIRETVTKWPIGLCQVEYRPKELHISYSNIR